MNSYREYLWVQLLRCAWPQPHSLCAFYTRLDVKLVCMGKDYEIDI